MRLLPLVALLWVSPVWAQPSPENSPSVRVSSEANGHVNLNQASSEELERLPGIGPAKAKAIVDFRHAHPFRRIDEIVKVKGIGRKTYAKLKPYLAVAGQTTLKE